MSKEPQQNDDEAHPESFEEALAYVQQIVRAMESGRLTLEDSLKSYERGIKSIRQCHEFLNRFEKKVQMLVGFDAEGNPVTEDFDNEEMTLEEKQQNRGRRRGAGGKRKSDLEKPEDGLF